MDGGIEIIEANPRGGIGFHFKFRDSGKLFRLLPSRCPQQPRLWCFWVYRCRPGGSVDSSDLPWIGGAGMTREELPQAAQAIRDDMAAWLRQESHEGLRRWLLAEDGDESSTPAVALPSGTGRRVRL